MTLESRGALQDFIANQAAENSSYREALMRDPKGTLESHTGSKLPDWLNVKIAEETANTIYLIAPHVPGEELADEDLEQVAGGGIYGGGNTSTRGGGDECSKNYGSFNSTVTISGSGRASVSGDASGS
jgi:hypothetical protein